MAVILDTPDLFTSPLLYCRDWQWSHTDLEQQLQPVEYPRPPVTWARGTRRQFTLENSYLLPLTCILITVSIFLTSVGEKYFFFHLNGSIYN